MATHVEVISGGYKFVYTNDSDGSVIAERELKMVYRNEPGGDHLIRVGEFVNGVEVAEPVRFKPVEGGQRIAADFPGCNPTYVVTDSEGRITNG